MDYLLPGGNVDDLIIGPMMATLPRRYFESIYLIGRYRPAIADGPSGRFELAGRSGRPEPASPFQREMAESCTAGRLMALRLRPCFFPLFNIGMRFDCERRWNLVFFRRNC